ncbi:MAG: hypothetical protein HYY52_08400 [Candidatus Melainabacteria bacterium]|nr:hypothetical protein [Candidatus Melainabacteria bacterium]
MPKILNLTRRVFSVVPTKRTYELDFPDKVKQDQNLLKLAAGLGTNQRVEKLEEAIGTAACDAVSYVDINSGFLMKEGEPFIGNAQLPNLPPTANVMGLFLIKVGENNELVIEGASIDADKRTLKEPPYDIEKSRAEMYQRYRKKGIFLQIPSQNLVINLQSFSFHTPQKKKIEINFNLDAESKRNLWYIAQKAGDKKLIERMARVIEASAREAITIIENVTPKGENFLANPFLIGPAPIDNLPELGAVCLFQFLNPEKNGKLICDKLQVYV